MWLVDNTRERVADDQGALEAPRGERKNLGKLVDNPPDVWYYAADLVAGLEGITVEDVIREQEREWPAADWPDESLEDLLSWAMMDCVRAITP